MDAQKGHSPFSLSSHHLDGVPRFKKKKRVVAFSAMRNQHLRYSWGLIPLVFLVNTTGNVPSIPVPLMYFFEFILS